MIWVFPELSILRTIGQIGDLCDLPLMVLDSMGDLNFVNIFLAVVRVFVASSFCSDFNDFFHRGIYFV